MSSTPGAYRICCLDLPIEIRPSPLYGNITSVSTDGEVCEISTDPKKSKHNRIYVFSIGDLPINVHSRALYRAIEDWVMARSTGDARYHHGHQDGSNTDEKALECGPRVTFYDADQLDSAIRRARRPPLPPPKYTLNDRPGYNDQLVKSASSQSSLGGGTMSRSRSNSSSRSGSKGTAAGQPGRATDVGLCCWTSDLHGSHA